MSTNDTPQMPPSSPNPSTPQWAAPNQPQPSASQMPTWQAPQGSQPLAPGSWQAPTAPPASDPQAVPTSPYVQSAPPTSSPYASQATPLSPTPTTAAQFAGAQPGMQPDNPFMAYQINVAQPGVIPLRPLSIGDLFDGTFKTVRSNPGVMFGLSAVLMSIVGLITALATYFMSPSVSMLTHFSDPETLQELDRQFTNLFVVFLVSALAIPFAVSVLTGLLSKTTSNAVLGRRTSVSEAWASSKGYVLRLLLFTFLFYLVMAIISTIILLVFATLFVALIANPNEIQMTIISLLVIPSIILAVSYGFVRLVYAPTVIVLEGQGIFASIGRSWRLTKKNFWGTLGRLILLGLMGTLISLAVNVVFGIFTAAAVFFLPLNTLAAVSAFVSSLISAVSIPLQAAFITLMYVDRRMRVEGLADTLAKTAQEA